ncbi:hypothetical protein L9F63_020193, partial [Diploptera punctata]
VKYGTLRRRIISAFDLLKYSHPNLSNEDSGLIFSMDYTLKVSEISIDNVHHLETLLR